MVLIAIGNPFGVFHKMPTLKPHPTLLKQTPSVCGFVLADLCAALTIFTI